MFRRIPGTDFKSLVAFFLGFSLPAMSEKVGGEWRGGSSLEFFGGGGGRGVDEEQRVSECVCGRVGDVVPCTYPGCCVCGVVVLSAV